MPKLHSGGRLIAVYVTDILLVLVSVGKKFELVDLQLPIDPRPFVTVAVACDLSILTLTPDFSLDLTTLRTVSTPDCIAFYLCLVSFQLDLVLVAPCS